MRKEEDQMKKGIEISGTIFATEGSVDHDEFLNKFIEFVEVNGWEFGGGSAEVNTEESDIKE